MDRMVTHPFEFNFYLNAHVRTLTLPACARFLRASSHLLMLLHVTPPSGTPHFFGSTEHRVNILACQPHGKYPSV